MIFELDFSKNSLDTIVDQLSSSDLPDWMEQHLNFLKKYNSFDEFEITTSGTTGAPKIILVTKLQMQISATATLKFFNLKQGMTCFLCLSSEYIAGKMMLVRAIIGRLKVTLTQPTSEPSKYINQLYDFIPLVPTQAKELLSTGKREFINTLLIGGGQVERSITDLLEGCKVEIFESFAMTETLSHFAIKRINPAPQNFFTTLPGFKISASEEMELILLENELTDAPIYSKDIIEFIDEVHFRWLGRSDNLINSGGIKIIPEIVEEKLKKSIPNRAFFVGGVPHIKFGQEVNLFVEGSDFELSPSIFDELDKFQIPKKTLFIKEFSRTSSGKIKRSASIQKTLT